MQAVVELVAVELAAAVVVALAAACMHSGRSSGMVAVELAAVVAEKIAAVWTDQDEGPCIVMKRLTELKMGHVPKLVLSVEDSSDFVAVAVVAADILVAA